MRNCKTITTALVAALVLGAPAASLAQSVNAGASTQIQADARFDGIRLRGAERIVAELMARGFEEIETGRTLLGRVRIEAEAKDMVRVIVVHQSSGEILSDVINVTGTAAAEARSAAQAGILTVVEQPLGAQAAFSGSADAGVSVGGVSVGGGLGAGIGIGN